MVEKGQNSPHSRISKSAIESSSSSSQGGNRLQHRETNKSPTKSSNGGGRPRVASKSIAIPKLQNNSLWFDDDEKSVGFGDGAKYAGRKAITRHKAKFPHTNFAQDQNKKENEESNAKVVAEKAESSSNMYIERWARSRRSSSDNEPASLSPNTPPTTGPQPQLAFDNSQGSHKNNVEQTVPMSTSATRKRRGSKVSSDMRQDNFKRQHTNQNHIESGSHIDDWGWFVDVPFSPEKVLSPKSFGKRKKTVNSYTAKEMQGESKYTSGPILSHMTRQFNEIDQKQRVANGGSSGDRSEKPKTSTEQSSGTHTVAATESNVIGTSNSLLKLWEKATISKVSSAEQAMNQLGSSTKEYLETANPTLNHVSSFCFEMDL